MSSGVQNTILAFIAVAALALLVQTIGIVVLLLMARKAVKNVREEIEHYRASILPLIHRARELVQNVAPKLESAAEELSVITTKLREQTDEVQATASDILARTHTQVSRVDHMVTNVFDGVERAGVFMTSAVSKPMRQLSGVIASIRAAVEVLREPRPAQRAQSSRSGYAYAAPVPEPEAAVPPAGPATPVPPL